MRSRKADLSLSVNSIIILIFAVTILGLGLAFIKSQLGGAMDQFKQWKEIRDPEPPNGANIITISPGYVPAKPGTQSGMKVSVYAERADIKNAKPEVVCGSILSMDPAEANTKSITAGTYETFQVAIPVPRTVEAKDYVCLVRVANVGSVDFTLGVSR